MSSFTFADNKLGGRLTACCDAIAASHLNRAAGILAELADELNVEATNAGLLADDVLVLDTPVVPAKTTDQCDITIDPGTTVRVDVPQAPVTSAPADLQMCGRNVHAYGAADPISGWRTCSICGVVNVAPPEGGPIDMSARQ